MQFRDLKTQYRKLKDDIDMSMQEVTNNCNFIMGTQVKELEKDLAEYVGVKHCITCANGTDALSLAMLAWDIGEGDGVFVPDFTFFSSAEIVSHAGATPIFIDVDENSFNIDVEKLEDTIKATMEEGKIAPKVILAVDLFGLPADYKALRKIADKYNLYLLEDGAQGFGGQIGKEKACSFGDISTTSFFPAKPLGCYGDGGAVFTDNDQWAKLLDSYRVHGKGEDKYDNIRIGLNSRLDTIQAAVLKVKLKAFEDYEVKDINKIADKYTEKLKIINLGGELVRTPIVNEGFTSSWAQYTIKLKNKSTRDKLQAHLKDRGIPSMIYYQKPMHSQSAFAGIESKRDFSVTNKLCETVLSLPMHPYLTDNHIDEVVNAIKEMA